MTLEQYVTKPVLLADEAGYPARQKDRMVHDTILAGISNDVVCGKIIKKGPNLTLAQDLEISRLETPTQQSLFQMSNTKPLVNYVRYDKKKKYKGGKHSQQQAFENSIDLETLLSNSKLDANGKFQTKGKICYRCGKGKHQLDQKCAAIDAICNKCGKKGHFAVICQKGKGFSCSSKSAHVVETSNSVSISQTEPDYYTECGQPIYVQSHMLQTMSTKVQKIPEKSKLMLEFPI